MNKKEEKYLLNPAILFYARGIAEVTLQRTKIKYRKPGYEAEVVFLQGK